MRLVLLRRVESEGANALLVIGQHDLGLACSEVPQPDSTIMAASDHLWIGSLADNISHRISVSSERVDTSLCPHVPHLHTTGGHTSRTSVKVTHTRAEESRPPVISTSIVG